MSDGLMSPETGSPSPDDRVPVELDDTGFGTDVEKEDIGERIDSPFDPDLIEVQTRSPMTLSSSPPRRRALRQRRTLAAVALALALTAGLFTGTSRSAAADETRSATRVANPYEGADAYVNPRWSANAAAEPGGSAVADQPTAVWLDSIATIEGDDDAMGLRDHLDAALAQNADLITLTLYNLPGRGCDRRVATGELSSHEIDRYKAEFIDPITGILSLPDYADLRIVTIVEPHALANLLTRTGPREDGTAACDEMLSNGNYLEGIGYALAKLGALPHTYNHLDLSHHGRLGWDAYLTPAAEVDALAGVERSTEQVLADWAPQKPTCRLKGCTVASQKERMLAGELYLAADPELTADLTRAAELCERFNASSFGDRAARKAILAELVGELGDRVEVRPPLWVDYGSRISIGSGSFLNFGTVLLDVAKITIGEDVLFGPNVQLLTPTHPFDPRKRRAKWEAAEPITIGDNVWLGGGVIVCPGVTIGENTVVGAGAVVTKDLPANVLAVGNPARVIRAL